MKPCFYTVLLLLPDYLATNYGEETYLIHVMAKNVKDAVEKARLSATVAHQFETALKDYFVLFVTKGRCVDLTHRLGE